MNTALSSRSATFDGQPENAVRSFVRTVGLLERVMHTYFARYHITGSQWGVLRTLDRAEAQGLPGLRLTDLSNRLIIRPPSVTGVVDRLQRDGLVRRASSPTDHRAKPVRLTTKGRQLIKRMRGVHQRHVQTVLGALTDAEQAQLHSLLGRLADHLEKLLQQGDGTYVEGKRS